MLTDGHQPEGIHFRFRNILNFFAFTQYHIVSNGHILSNNGLVHNCVPADSGIPHDNGVFHDSTLANVDIRPNHRILHLTIYLAALTNQAFAHHGLFWYILGRNDISLCIDSPELLIEIKFRNNIYQLHISFPVRTQSPHVFPIAIILISKQTLLFIMAVWQNVHTKVAVILILFR